MPGYRAPLLDASRVGHFPLIPGISLLPGWLSQRYREAYHAELTTLECGFPRVISHFYFSVTRHFMLSLQSETSERWLQQVDENLDEILIDHAHCEKKAAGTAMSLISAYVDRPDLTHEMVIIVNEELEHFEMVLELLKERGIRFRRLKACGYGRQLNDLIDKQEPRRAVDRLLIAGLIEARSCERFDLLRQHVQDPQLSEFYGSLFESEARHHSTYVRLARTFASDEMVEQRLDELARAEAELIADGDPLPRMHS